MREFKYGLGVIAPNFLLNLLLIKISEKSSTKADFRGKNKKDTSDNGSSLMSYKNTYFPCKVIYITVEHFSIDTLKIFNIISSLHRHGMRESRRGSLNKKLKR